MLLERKRYDEKENVKSGGAQEERRIPVDRSSIYYSEPSHDLSAGICI